MNTLLETHRRPDVESTPAAAERHGLLTKLLHAALLLSVLWQLLGVELAERPRAGRPGNFFYEVHEAVGLATLGLVLAFWLWTVVRRRGTPVAALLPWFSSQRRAAVLADMKAQWARLRMRQMPAPGAETPLASAIHGLGLLTALAMAATGAWLFLQPVPHGSMLEVHEALSNLMWAYVVGHAGMAAAHQFTAHPVLKRMFARAAESGETR